MSRVTRGRAGLDREKIVRAAAELLGASCGHEITLGAVAARLGVRTPSLYNHIAGYDELRRDLALLGTRELGARIARAVIGKSGEVAILAIGDAYRAFAKERPGLYLIAQRAPAPEDVEHAAASEEIVTVLRLVLEPYRLSATDQIHAIRGLRSLMHGLVSLEQSGGFGLPVDVDTTYRRLLLMFIGALRHDTAAVSAS